MPFPTDDDPLGVDDLATHRLPVAEASAAYGMFQRKVDGAVTIMLNAWHDLWFLIISDSSTVYLVNPVGTRVLSTSIRIGESRDEPYL